MKRTYLMTGFPGFLATKLIEHLALFPDQIDRFYLLHLKHEEEQAVARRDALIAGTPLTADQLVLVTGDITMPGLGLQEEAARAIRLDVTHLFHLAALYDLSTAYAPAYRINVEGTSHVTRFAHGCSSLERYIYFSTAYVAGLRQGIIREDELVPGEFKNAYEETKFLAEQRFHEEVGSLPYTIIRPGIVVGHSESGETPKWDGVYFVLNAMRMLERFAPLPYAGAVNAEVNLVPYDFVVRATAYLSHDPKGICQTYHLTDPFPHGARALYRMLHEAYFSRPPRGMVPFRLVSSLLTPRVAKLVQMQRETLDYFVHPAHFDCTNTVRDLHGSGIVCPDFKEVIPRIVHYYKEQHPSKPRIPQEIH